MGYGWAGCGWNWNRKVSGVIANFGPDFQFQLVQLGSIIPVKKKNKEKSS